MPLDCFGGNHVWNVERPLPGMTCMCGEITETLMHRDCVKCGGIHYGTPDGVCVYDLPLPRDSRAEFEEARHARSVRRIVDAIKAEGLTVDDIARAMEKLRDPGERGEEGPDG